MKIIKRITLITIILLLGLLTLPEDRTYACSCVGGSTEEKLDRSTAVFAGKVIEKGGTKKSQFGGLREYTFDVHMAWKGVQSNIIKIFSYDGKEASCGFEFNEGESYLVYSYLDKDNLLQTNLCSGNSPISQAENEIKQLGTGTKFSEEFKIETDTNQDSNQDTNKDTNKETSKGSIYFPVLAFGLGIIIIISILIYWRFKKGNKFS